MEENRWSAGGLEGSGLSIADTEAAGQCRPAPCPPVRPSYSTSNLQTHLPAPQENMFELLAKQPSINDSPGATDLAVTQHDVSFKDVSFEVGMDGGARCEAVCRCRAGQSCPPAQPG